MKKKMIIGIAIGAFMVIAMFVVIKSNKEVKAYKLNDGTTECALEGACSVEGQSYSIEALN